MVTHRNIEVHSLTHKISVGNMAEISDDAIGESSVIDKVLSGVKLVPGTYVSDSKLTRRLWAQQRRLLTAAAAWPSPRRDAAGQVRLDSSWRLLPGRR
jgi:hypothetical protein